MRCVLLPGARSRAGTEKRMCWLHDAKRIHCQSDEIIAAIKTAAQVARLPWHMRMGAGRWPQRTGAGGVLALRTVKPLPWQLLLGVLGVVRRYLKL